LTRYRHDGLSYADTTIINCRIPTWLHDQIMLLIVDPATGIARKRGWSIIIEEGMKLWLERQQTSQN